MNHTTTSRDADRTATVETAHTDAATAETVAAAVRPDNTADVVTSVDGATVRTRITRETTGGLQSSVDDYVVNLSVATEIVESVDATGAGSQQDSTADARQDSLEARRTDTTTDTNDTDADTDTHDT
jgi:hypothetical protein